MDFNWLTKALSNRITEMKFWHERFPTDVTPKDVRILSGLERLKDQLIKK